MHGRRIKGIQNALRLQGQVRCAATAAAFKTQPRSAGKWEVVEKRRDEPLTQRQTLGKWAPSTPLKTRTSSDVDRNDRLGESSRRPRPVIRWNKDKGEQNPSASAPAFPTIQKLAKVTSNRQTKQLQREPAPHLQIASGSGTENGGHSSYSQRVPSFEESTDHQRPNAIVADDVGTLSEGKQVQYAVDLPSKHVANRRTPRHKDQYKERGSLVQLLHSDIGEGLEIPKHQRFAVSQNVGKRQKASMKVFKPVSVDVFIPTVVSVQNLARLLDVRLEKLQTCMRSAGMADESSHDYILNADTACLFALEFNKNPIVDDEAAFDLYADPAQVDNSSLPRRPPVVTIMGHVDHGKTTLLDSLRSSSVAKGEAGGITQHIGAFSVSVPKSSSASTSPSSEEATRSITFLDTPGHAAFSAMRARGARVTDIIVLVVAADDGVMPQTREVIKLIKRESDKVGLVVAINKVDKPGADVESVQNALWAEGIHLESMGGDVPSVEVSGLTGQGLDQLLEIISVLAEIRDVRADVGGPVLGYILESKVLRGFGNTATVLLLRGSLTAASHLICGTTHAKVRHLTDSSGMPIKCAIPGSAVIVSGWKELPQVGNEVLQGKEDEVKKALANRLRKMKLATTLNDAEVINATRRAERERKADDNIVEEEPNVTSPTEPKVLRLVVKGDVSGSVEALVSAVEAIGNKDATVNVVQAAVGEVTESDVMMAKAAEGMVIAFAVPVSRPADQVAAQIGVKIYTEKIIYRVLDEVKERVIELLPKITETRVTGEATVQQIFDIHGKGKMVTKVAGCRVGNGTLRKDCQAKVFRDGELLHDGHLQTLRILKRDATEVKKGLECGLSFVKFDDLRERDFIQMYEVIEKCGRL